MPGDVIPDLAPSARAVKLPTSRSTHPPQHLPDRRMDLQHSLPSLHHVPASLPSPQPPASHPPSQLRMSRRDNIPSRTSKPPPPSPIALIARGLGQQQAEALQPRPSQQPLPVPTGKRTANPLTKGSPIPSIPHAPASAAPSLSPRRRSTPRDEDGASIAPPSALNKWKARYDTPDDAKGSGEAEGLLLGRNAYEPCAMSLQVLDTSHTPPSPKQELPSTAPDDSITPVPADAPRIPLALRLRDGSRHRMEVPATSPLVPAVRCVLVKKYGAAKAAGMGVFSHSLVMDDAGGEVEVGRSQ
ncbi:hypothetical protein HK101_011327, partial [Irineochytrium annulatum]